ncbi:MAG: hypothetical protein J6Y68_00755 [Clostridia bacterium]|nr:hypothetical protein [Clostridia bacterium]
MNKSLVRLTEEDFLDAVIDTRFDLEITGIKDKKSVEKKLVSLYGEREFDFSSGTIFIEGEKSPFKSRYSAGDLAYIMNVLVSEEGCPWDKVQTHESIRINAIEEAYELTEAINNKDIPNIEEETGDLLLQAVFHANIAKRSGEFDINDVISTLCAKLVSRHTHIFGSNKAATPEEALLSWEAAKAKEKHAESLESKLKRIPETFPALLRFQKAISKLVKDGLENDVNELSSRELAVAICGAIKSGADCEADLLAQINEISSEYLSGQIKKVSDYLE